MDKKDRLYKLFQGSETAIWAHDEIVRQDKRIAELESQNLGLTKTLVEFEQEREIRDLEQQVVGIHKALAWVRKNKSSDSYSRARLEKYALSLLDETEQLKEQGE